MCKLYNQNVVEVEYQFVLCCTQYSDISTKYLSDQALHTLNKSNAFMSNNNSKLLYKIFKFVTERFEIRTYALNNLLIIIKTY